MKNVFVLIIALLSLVSVGCEKDIDPNSDCDLTFMEGNWIATTESENFGCAFYLEKYSYGGRFYYSLGSHCADIATNIASCGGDNLCDSEPNLCNKIFEKGERIGIVAYLED